MASCQCNNTCSRSGKRGSCPCKQMKRYCSDLCQCGHLLPCTNREDQPIDGDLSFAEFVRNQEGNYRQRKRFLPLDVPEIPTKVRKQSKIPIPSTASKIKPASSKLPAPARSKVKSASASAKKSAKTSSKPASAKTSAKPTSTTSELTPESLLKVQNWKIVHRVPDDTRNLFNRTSSNHSSSTLNVTLVQLSLEDNGLTLQCNIGDNYSNHVEVIVLAPPDLPENITLRETTGVDLDNLTVTLTCTSTCDASGRFKFTWDTDLEGNTTDTFLNSYGCYNTCSQNVTIRMDSGQKKEVSCTVTNLKTGKNLTAQYDLHRKHEGGGTSSEDADNLKSIWFTVGIVGILALAASVLVVLKGRNSLRKDETVYIESHEYATCNDEMVTTEEYLSTRVESRRTKAGQLHSSAVMRNSQYALEKTPQVVSDEEDNSGATTNEYFCLEDNDKVLVENTLYEAGGVVDQFQLKDSS